MIAGMILIVPSSCWRRLSEINDLQRFATIDLLRMNFLRSNSSRCVFFSSATTLDEHVCPQQFPS